jgi:hypothetical protein
MTDPEPRPVEALARLREQADRGHAPAWIAEQEGDELCAVVTGIKPAVRTSYGHVPVLELEELGSHTPWSLWLLHAVLRREVWRARPAAGETLYVRYDGRVVPEGGGAPYEAYTVIVDRPDQGDELDWDALARRYDPDFAGPPDPAGPPPPAREPGDDEAPF